MFDELLEIVKEFFKKLFSSRLFALSVIFTVMFAGLLGKLFQMQILDGSEYQETYMQRTEKNVTTPGSRGNIYDRNGNRLAYNELAYSVTIQDFSFFSFYSTFFVATISTPVSATFSRITSPI